MNRPGDGDTNVDTKNWILKIGYYWIWLVENHFAFALNIEIVRSNLRGVQGARKFLTQLLELARPVSM